jgi:hypothetical protein
MGNLGRFNTKDECLANLADGATEYAAMTGLTPWYSWCSKEFTFSFKKGWGLNYQTVGKTAVNLHGVNFPMFGKALMTRGNFVQLITDAAAAQDLTVIDVAMHGQIASYDAMLHYYGDKRIYVNVIESLKFETGEACLAQIQTVNEITADSPVFINYCQDSSVVSKIEMVHVLTGDLKVAHGQMYDRFEKMEDCQAVKHAQQADAQARFGDRFVGGSCAYAIGDNRVREFSYNYFVKI